MKPRRVTRTRIRASSRRAPSRHARSPAAVKEVAARKQAKEAMRESAARLWSAADAAGFGAYTYDFVGGASHWSPELKTLLGVPPDQPLPLDTDLLPLGLHAEDRAAYLAALAAANDPHGNGVFRHEYRVLHPNGTVRWLQIRGLTTFAGEGAARQAVRATGVVFDITERKRVEYRLRRLTDCLLSFSVDPLDNINRLTALCGELLGATCALYNRIEGGLLCSLGQWHTPPDYVPQDRPEGHICYDSIRQGGDDILVVRNLPETTYFATDPNVARFNLKSYVGKAVVFSDTYVGSLCAVFDRDFEPDETDRELVAIIAAAIGIEEARRHAGRALQESEARYRGLFNAGHDAIAVFPVGPGGMPGRFTEVNERACRSLGYTPAEMRALSPVDLVPLRDRDRIPTLAARLIASRSLVAEMNCLRKDGREMPVEMSARVFEMDGRPTAILMVRDITARRQVEAELRELSGRLLRLQDDERRRLARELHDTTAQELAAISMNLAVLKARAPELKAGAQAILAETAALTDRCASEIRTMSYLLHPPALEALGLAGAGRDYADGFARRSGIRVDLQISDDLGRLAVETELTLFRVLQESLANIHRHSGSRTASIRLTRMTGQIRLEVRDTGCGMNLTGGLLEEGLPASGLGVGILGMRERLRQLGGQLKLKSNSQGTCVIAIVPLGRQTDQR
jgi:PAS domain S-box-containing protein